MLEEHHIFGGPNVFVPYRGIYFLYPLRVVERRVRMMRFRPLSGNLLSLPHPEASSRSKSFRFRPLSGNLLSLQKVRKEHDTEVLFSSPIGESTFSTRRKEN